MIHSQQCNWHKDKNSRIVFLSENRYSLRKQIQEGSNFSKNVAWWTERKREFAYIIHMFNVIRPKNLMQAPHNGTSQSVGKDYPCQLSPLCDCYFLIFCYWSIPVSSSSGHVLHSDRLKSCLSLVWELSYLVACFCYDPWMCYLNRSAEIQDEYIIYQDKS